MAQAINDQMNQDMGNAKIGLGAAITYFTQGFSGLAAKAIAGITILDAIYDNNYADYSFGLEAGDTLIVSSYSGALVGSMAGGGVTRTVTVYDSSILVVFTEVGNAGQ